MPIFPRPLNGSGNLKTRVSRDPLALVHTVKQTEDKIADIQSHHWLLQLPADHPRRRRDWLRVEKALWSKRVALMGVLWGPTRMRKNEAGMKQVMITLAVLFELAMVMRALLPRVPNSATIEGRNSRRSISDMGLGAMDCESGKEIL
jgi:hypothetical protein